MKAAVAVRYGKPYDVRFAEIEKPVPSDGEILIKVRAASVNAADIRILSGFGRILGFGLLKPDKKRLGADVSGIVEAVGSGVTRFRPGDAVFGELPAAHGGTFAENVCAGEAYLAPKPENLTHAEAAAVPLAAITALQALRDKGRIQAGQRVMIYGASGGVGSYAVQLAKAFGGSVTAVCSTKNLETARALGVDDAVDYLQEDFSRRGVKYDLILAANGNRPIKEYLGALSENGTCVITGGSGGQLLQAALRGKFPVTKGSRSVVSMTAHPDLGDLLFLKSLIEAGKLKPIIAGIFPLYRLQDALGLVGEGHARGKVVVII